MFREVTRYCKHFTLKCYVLSSVGLYSLLTWENCLQIFSFNSCYSVLTFIVFLKFLVLLSLLIVLFCYIDVFVLQTRVNFNEATIALYSAKVKAIKEIFNTVLKISSAVVNVWKTQGRSIGGNQQSLSFNVFF